MNPPLQVIVDLHAELLEEHGGAPGLRDAGALEASVNRPLQIIAYGGDGVTIPELAAAICVSLCRNHPSIDGNKRAAFAALGLVLGLNGYELDAAEREAADKVLAVAAGTLDEAAFRDWVAERSFPV